MPADLGDASVSLHYGQPPRKAARVDRPRRSRRPDDGRSNVLRHARLPAQLEPMKAALDASFDKANLFEHLQMLRDRGLGGAEPPAKLACAPCPYRKPKT